MVIQIVDLIDLAVSSVSGWFLTIFEKTGMTPLYLCMMFLFLLCSYLLAPLFHHVMFGGFSDVAADIRKPFTKGKNYSKGKK